jgi:hypothetical protein
MSTQVTLLMRLLAFTVLTAVPVVARADDNLKDDTRKSGHDLKRDAKKAGHRVKEGACRGTTAECDAQKAKDRRREAWDKADDKEDERKAEAREKVEANEDAK